MDRKQVSGLAGGGGGGTGRELGPLGILLL